MKNKILLTLILLIPSLCFGEKYITLKDPDYKNLEILIEDINPDHLSGITEEEVLNEIKLLCLQSGIKVRTDTDKDRYLYFRISIMDIDKYNDIYYLSFKYKRLNRSGIMFADTGILYVPDQGKYGTLGIASSKESILSIIRREFKFFLVDYLESNI